MEPAFVGVGLGLGISAVVVLGYYAPLVLAVVLAVVLVVVGGYAAVRWATKGTMDRREALLKKLTLEPWEALDKVLPSWEDPDHPLGQELGVTRRSPHKDVLPATDDGYLIAWDMEGGKVLIDPRDVAMVTDDGYMSTYHMHNGRRQRWLKHRPRSQNAGKLMVLEGGMKYQQIAPNVGAVTTEDPHVEPIMAAKLLAKGEVNHVPYCGYHAIGVCNYPGPCEHHARTHRQEAV